MQAKVEPLILNQLNHFAHSENGVMETYSAFSTIPVLIFTKKFRFNFLFDCQYNLGDVTNLWIKKILSKVRQLQ